MSESVTRRSPLLRSIISVFLGILPAACGNTTGGGGSVQPDLQSAEVDCVAHPEQCHGCNDDSHCANIADAPRCDVPTRTCVACLPSADNCPAGQICQSVNKVWTCSLVCAANADCSKLGGGSLCCGGHCVDPATDLANCGSCGNVCPQPSNGSASCVAGNCVIGSCNSGFDDCDKAAVNGCETAVSSDPINCGKCGNGCKPFQNGLPTCTNSTCSAVCAPGFADCNKDIANGCEVDTTYDINNCGGCAKACSAPANAVPFCDQSRCSFRCKLGYGDCDGNAANGCEVSSNSDPQHCGHCGNICPLRPNSNAASCGNGQCVNSCIQGFGDCDNNSFNGCEANLSNSVAACGGCGKLCKGNNAIATCSQGMCSLQCNPGFVDCNLDPKDGCEANLLSDGANCGGCGMACPMNTPFCQKGMCINLPPTCREVAGVRWCYHPNCGVPCNQTCMDLGLPLTIDNNTWFMAQTSLPQCVAIATAFGLPNNVSVASYSYGCVENEAQGDTNGGPLTGRIICSSFNGCPQSLRTTMDAVGVACANGGRHAICPCQ